MNKGFQYTIEEEKIIEYLKLSTADKLQWLEEINEFNRIALDEREKEIRIRLRAAEI
ncbi:MAG: hypothetical protein HY879_28215 [Deltaproteobacteria bacterium]|nr:hypothetical protein [Deltaproteobacteria bacterium]